jgi:hypothetical protein
MSATAEAIATPTTTDPVQRWLERRAKAAIPRRHKSAQAAECGPRIEQELPLWPLRGESVVRKFNSSAQAAECGPKTEEELPLWPLRGESVVCEFLRRQEPTTGQSGSRSVLRDSFERASINRANSQHSTGPRTEAGKQRSSLNALRHGLTAASPVLPSEDPAAYEDHRRRFFNEFQPATPTESQLVQELVDTSWRLNRIPLLEADVLARAAAPIPPDQEITFDIVDAHRLIANLGIQSQRLSRQFQKSLATLHDIQAGRAERERRDLQDAAALLELHKHKGVPWQPSEHGFVFSKDRVERFAERVARLNEARHIEHVRFRLPPTPRRTPLGTTP